MVVVFSLCWPISINFFYYFGILIHFPPVNRVVEHFSCYMDNYWWHLRDLGATSRDTWSSIDLIKLCVLLSATWDYQSHPCWFSVGCKVLTWLCHDGFMGLGNSNFHRSHEYTPTLCAVSSPGCLLLLFHPFIF